MIEQLLVFKETGILLLKRNLQKKINKEAEELVTGFFSVVFQYFSKNFGRIEKIQTSKNLILISKIGDVYISLVSSWIDKESKIPIHDNRYFLNKRLEEIAVNTMRIIEDKVRKYYHLHEILQTEELESIIDNVLDAEMEKMDIIRSLINGEQINSDFMKVYRGF